jgi:hypothetical protein
MLAIMLLTGAFGGIINFFLPENNPTKKEYLKPWYNCIILGLGATLLVPLFLELAQSKLMDNIRFDGKLEAPKTGNADSMLAKTTAVLNTKTVTDSLKIAQISALLKEKNNTGTQNENQGKNYLLWTAYCLLAGAAGFKFINMLISGVFKAKEIQELKGENAKLENEQTKRVKNAQKSQEEELKKAIGSKKSPDFKGLANMDKMINDATMQPLVLSLPPVTVSNDPQKNRFGGRDLVNGRQLKATVKPTDDDDFFAVDIWVETADKENPLDEVLFFLHDSFSPSVRKIISEDGSIAKMKTLNAYGAFTVGAVTDNGSTLLELDLAFDTPENKYPKKFKER